MKGEYWLAVVTLINALLVIIITIRQYQLSKERFKFDLFEKRYAVYKGAQKFLTKILRGSKFELNDLFEFRGETQDSVFLFDDDITEYLRDIDAKALDFWEKHERLNGVPKGRERSEICEEITNLSHRLTSQLPELKNKFAPYLKFKTWK